MYFYYYFIMYLYVHRDNSDQGYTDYLPNLSRGAAVSLSLFICYIYVIFIYIDMVKQITITSEDLRSNMT